MKFHSRLLQRIERVEMPSTAPDWDGAIERDRFTGDFFIYLGPGDRYQVADLRYAAIFWGPYPTLEAARQAVAGIVARRAV